MAPPPVSEDPLRRSIETFHRVRAEVSAEGVSWLCVLQQLELLIRRYPERARAVLADVDRVRETAPHTAVRTRSTPATGDHDPTPRRPQHARR